MVIDIFYSTQSEINEINDEDNDDDNRIIHD